MTGSSITSLAPLQSALKQAAEDLRGNPRLQLGLLGIGAIALTWGLLVLSDQQQTALKQLETTQAEVRMLDKKLGGSNRQQSLREQLDHIHAQIDHLTWQAPTVVIAQADFADWLAAGLNEAGIKQPIITQPTFHPVGPDRGEPTQTETTQLDCSKGKCPLVELKTQVRFGFEPASFAKALAFIEGTEKQLTIEQLSVNVNERKVEATVRGLARISGQFEDLETPNNEIIETRPESPLPQQGEQDKPAGPAKKTVEIKW